MPRSPKKPCAYPGCPNLSDQRYCEKHRKLVDQNYNRYTRSPDVHRKYGRQWQRIRTQYAQAHPLCEKCFEEGRATLMEEVHHILPVSRGGSNDQSNLMSLCRSCHNKIHHELGDRCPLGAGKIGKKGIAEKRRSLTYARTAKTDGE